MAKLNKTERDKLTLVVRELCLQGYDLKEIQEEIDNIFGVYYSERCLMYYKQKAFKEEWLQELDKQNKIIRKWNETLESLPESSEVLAENIYLAVKKHDIEVHKKLENEIVQ